MTVPSRDVVRHYHRHHGWALVADTDDLDIYTYRPTDDGRFLMRVLDCDGTRIAHNYVNVRPAEVVTVVAAHLRWELSS